MNYLGWLGLESSFDGTAWSSNPLDSGSTANLGLALKHLHVERSVENERNFAVRPNGRTRPVILNCWVATYASGPSNSFQHSITGHSGYFSSVQDLGQISVGRQSGSGDA